MGSFTFSDPISLMIEGEAGPPPGWDTEFGNGVAFNFTTAPGGMFPLAGTAGAYLWYRNQATTLTSPDVGGAHLSLFTLFFGIRIPGYQGPHDILQLNARNTLGTLVPIFKLAFENDLTISANAGAAVVSIVNPGNEVAQYPEQVGKPLLDNSANTSIRPRFEMAYDTWYYVRLDLQFGNRPDLPGNPVTVGGDVNFEGQQVINIEGTPIGIGSGDFGGQATLSQVVFLNPGTIDLSQLYLSGPALDYPFPVPKRQIRGSQAPVEVAEKLKDASVLVSQAPIELPLLSSNSHVRISQMVIELPPGAAPFSGTGWQVKEA